MPFDYDSMLNIEDDGVGINSYMVTVGSRAYIKGNAEKN